MNHSCNAIICRYHEIAIKGNNRNMFERIMVENLHHLLQNIPEMQVKRVRGRIWVQHKDIDAVYRRRNGNRPATNA